LPGEEEPNGTKSLDAVDMRFFAFDFLRPSAATDGERAEPHPGQRRFNRLQAQV